MKARTASTIASQSATSSPACRSSSIDWPPQLRTGAPATDALVANWSNSRRGLPPPVTCVLKALATISPWRVSLAWWWMRKRVAWRPPLGAN